MAQVWGDTKLRPGLEAFVVLGFVKLGVFSFLFPGIHKVNPELKNGITVVLFILVFMYFDIIWKLGFLITNNTVHIIGVVLKTLT